MPEPTYQSVNYSDLSYATNVLLSLRNVVLLITQYRPLGYFTHILF
jgi:hypothetical protein